MLWLLLGLLLLGGSAGSYFLFFNGNTGRHTVTAQNVQSSENKSESVMNSELQNSGSLSAENNSAAAPTGSAEISSASNQASTTTVPSNSNNKTKYYSDKNSLPQNHSIKNQTASAQNLPSSDASSIKKSETQNNFGKSGIIVGNENQAGEKIIETENEISNQQSTISHQNPTTPESNGITDSSLEKTKPGIVQSSPPSPDKNNDGISQIQAIPDSTPVVNKQISTLTNQPPSTLQKKIKWFVEGGVSYLNSAQIFSVDSNNYYASRRLSEEKKGGGTTNYNLYLGMSAKRFQFRSGFDLMRLSEDIEYDNRGQCFMLQGSAGNYDTTQTHIQQNNLVASRNGKSVNTYLGIPICVNYSFPLKSWRIEFGLGASAAFPLKWNSYYINKTVTDLENPYDQGLIRKTVFSYKLNAGICAPVSKHIETVFQFNTSRI